MCEMMDCNVVNHSDKEHQLERILSENLRMMPDKYDEVDKYGLSLTVDPEDDDKLHIENHNAFMDANTLKPQYKSQLQAHVKKHQVAYKEKERMGLDKIENEESKTNTEDDSKDSMDM